MEYFPANKLTRGQALYAYTQGSAYAEFAEKRKGKLAPGYEADFILVDRDLYTVNPPSILARKSSKPTSRERKPSPATSPPNESALNRSFWCPGPWGGGPDSETWEAEG